MSGLASVVSNGDLVVDVDVSLQALFVFSPGPVDRSGLRLESVGAVARVQTMVTRMKKFQNITFSTK